MREQDPIHDGAAKLMRPRPEAQQRQTTQVEEQAESTEQALLTQRLQQQYGHEVVSGALSGEDTSAMGTLVLAEWALGSSGLDSLVDGPTGSSNAVFGILHSDEWAASSAATLSRHETSSQPGHAHLAADLIRRSRGRALPAEVATRIQSVLGIDLSSTRIHTDSAAKQAAKAVNAHAFATGEDVFFAAGKYKPGTREGDELLLHELTHVKQHQEGRIPTSTGEGLQVSSPSDSHEREAVALAAQQVGMLHDSIGMRGDFAQQTLEGVDEGGDVSGNVNQSSMVHRSSDEDAQEDSQVNEDGSGIYTEGNPIDGTLLGHIETLIKISHSSSQYVVEVDNKYIKAGGYSWEAATIATVAGMAQQLLRPEMNVGLLTKIWDQELNGIVDFLLAGIGEGDFERFGQYKYPLPEYTRESFTLRIGREVLDAVATNFGYQPTEKGEQFEAAFDQIGLIDQLLLLCWENQDLLTNSMDVNRAKENGLSPARVFGALGYESERAQRAGVIFHYQGGILGKVNGWIKHHFAERATGGSTRASNGDWQEIAPAEFWAEVVLESAIKTREAVAAVQAEHAKDASDEDRAQAMRPRRLEFLSTGIFLLEHFNLEATTTLNFGGFGTSTLMAGQGVTNGNGDTLRFLDNIGGYVIYQNESDMMFYQQSWAGFNVEITLGGTAAMVVERTQGIEVLSSGMITMLAMVLPQGRVPLILANVAHAATQLNVSWEEVERAYQNIYLSYGWVEEEFPGLMKQILVGSGKIGLENLDLIDAGARMNAGAWLKYGARLFGDMVVQRKVFGSLVHVFFAATSALGMLTFEVDTEDAMSRTKQELKQTLSQLGIVDVIYWADQILSRPLETYQRLVTELRFAAQGAEEFGEVLSRMKGI